MYLSLSIRIPSKTSLPCYEKECRSITIEEMCVDEGWEARSNNPSWLQRIASFDSSRKRIAYFRESISNHRAESSVLLCDENGNPIAYLDVIEEITPSEAEERGDYTISFKTALSHEEFIRLRIFAMSTEVHSRAVLEVLAAHGREDISGDDALRYAEGICRILSVQTIDLIDASTVFCGKSSCVDWRGHHLKMWHILKDGRGWYESRGYDPLSSDQSLCHCHYEPSPEHYRLAIDRFVTVKIREIANGFDALSDARKVADLRALFSSLFCEEELSESNKTIRDLAIKILDSRKKNEQDRSCRDYHIFYNALLKAPLFLTTSEFAHVPAMRQFFDDADVIRSFLTFRKSLIDTMIFC